MDESFEFQAGAAYATELMDKYSHVDPAPYDSYLPIPQKYLDMLPNEVDAEQFWESFNEKVME